MLLKRSLYVLFWMSCLGFALGLTGCAKKQQVVMGGTGPDGPPPKHLIPKHIDQIPDAIPKHEPLSRYGNRFKKNSNVYVDRKKKYKVMATSRGYRAKGKASWYGTKFQGRRTSSGEPYDMFAMTAAHRTLPLPTYAKVTNIDNGKSIIVKVNDRGPFHRDRLIDVSYVAAHKLGILGNGTGRVEVESIDPRDHHGMPKNLKRNKNVNKNANKKDQAVLASQLASQEDSMQKDSMDTALESENARPVNGKKPKKNSHPIALAQKVELEEVGKSKKGMSQGHHNAKLAHHEAEQLPLQTQQNLETLDLNKKGNAEQKMIANKKNTAQKNIAMQKDKIGEKNIEGKKNIAVKKNIIGEKKIASQENNIITKNSKIEKKNTLAGQEKIFLQLGSFHEKGNAEILLKKLEKLSGQQSEILERNTKKGSEYRVRLGPFNNREEAQILNQKLNQLSKKDFPKSTLLIQP